MSHFNFQLEIDARVTDLHYLSTVLRSAKNKLEEEAPLSAISFAETFSIFGNTYLFVARNIPIDLFIDVKSWIQRLKRSLL
jgi:hypothetical protein